MIQTRFNRLNRVGALLLPGLLLTACYQNTAPNPPSTAFTEASRSHAGGQGKPTPTLRDEPLQALGLMDVSFSGLSDDPAKMQVTASAPTGLSASGLTDRGSIQLQLLSNGTFTTGKRGVDGMRYLYATFAVRNASAAGVAYPTARQNLTLVAASTPGTVNNTPFSKIQRFDGSDAPGNIAPTILPTAGLMFSRQTEAPALLPGAEDLQVYAEGEVASLTSAGMTRAFPFGYVVRNRTATANRNLAANPAPSAYDGVVTVALKLPLQPNAADDPYTFNMSFAVVDDSTTRVTESLEEQTLGNVQTRSALLGAGTQVALLCGSNYSGPNSLFVGSVTTAGAAGTDRMAHIGGDVALKSLPSAYAAVGNANLNTDTNSGLGQFYSAYPTTAGGASATLAFTGNSTSRGGSLNVAPNGSFVYTSKAGDGTPAVTDQLGYTVSDGRGCTSPTQNVPVSVAGRVWFSRNNTANGDGRQNTPFSTVAAMQNAAAAGDTLYLYRGNGTTTGQNQGLTLKPGQVLIGEGVALNVGAVSILPAGTQPSELENTGGAGLTLATGNTVKGLNIKGTSAGINGTNFGTLTADLGTVQATSGAALNLTAGTLAANITRLDAAANGDGVSLVGVGGSLSVNGTGTAGSGGTVQATGGVGYNIVPGSANLTLSLNRVQVKNSATAGLLFNTQASDTGSLKLTVQNSEFTDDTASSIQLNPAGTGNNSFTITGNTITHPNSGGGLIYSSAPRSASVADNARINNNTISVAAGGSGNGITVDQNGAGNARFEISGNTITAFGTYGISVSAQQAGSGRLDAVMQNNTISSPAGNGLDGMNMLSGTATTGDNNTLCVQVTGNKSSAATGSVGTAGLSVRQRAGTTFNIQGITNTSNAGVVTFFQTNNSPSTARFRNGTTLTPVNGTCNAPN